MKTALQMWTVRDEAEKDFYGTIARVAEMGYQGIEFKYTAELDAIRLKEHLAGLGIEAAAVSVNYSELENDFAAAANFVRTLGSKFAICPRYLFERKEDYVRLAPFFNEVGKKFKQDGIQFGYHNHGHEFTEFDGEYGLDLLYRLTDPELVHAEIDVCFATMKGLVPEQYIMKYVGRCAAVHMKDYSPGAAKGTVEVGRGSVNVGAVYEAAVRAGASWFIVEQDESQHPSLQSAEMSIDYLKNNGFYLND